MLTQVCNVSLSNFVKRKPVLTVVSWSAQCIERQARLYDKPKTWVFISLKVQCWSVKDNVVYCNILPSIKAAFLEVEKTMFTVSTLVPMFTITTLGSYARSETYLMLYLFEGKLREKSFKAWRYFEELIELSVVVLRDSWLLC